MNASPRDPSGRFLPGASPNPSGKPAGFRGLARKIKDETRNGDELVEFAVKVLRNETAETRDRLAALQWLSDRGFGKPLQSIELSADVAAHQAPQYDWSRLSIEERKELLAKIAAVRQLAPSSDSDDEAA